MRDETEKPPLEIRFGPVRSKRATSWQVSCDEHGVMPVEVKSRRKAHEAALLHLHHEHGGAGRLRELGHRGDRSKARRHAA